MKNLLIFLLGIMILETNCSPSLEQAPAYYQLQKASRFLWRQQSADGGWHSKTHSQMRGGTFLTAYVLYSLLKVPKQVYNPEENQINKALQFIRQQTNETGMLGISDSKRLDYPNYATAYALMVLKKNGEAKDSSLIQKMTTYLLHQQFTEQRKFNKQQPVYGAWGFGERDLAYKETGHVDLSHSTRILMALNGVSGFKAIAEKASYFYRLAQKQRSETRLHATGRSHKNIPYDGGFFASPVTVGMNKGGIAVDTTGAPYYFQSYATATCEGLLGLWATGLTKKDKPVSDALKWLEVHPKWSHPEGIPLDHPEQWHEVLFFYHLMIRSEVYALMEINGGWREKVVFLLKKRQQPDGSFCNPMAGKNKEDDPLLATAFAVEALVNSMAQ